MNANDITPKTNARLNRIRTICRSLKIMLLLYVGCVFVFLPRYFHFIHKTSEGYWTIFYGTYKTLAEVPWIEKSLALFCVGMLLAAIATGYQLLGIYERGIIFSARNVQLLRRIGLLVASYGVVTVLGGTLFLIWGNWIQSANGYLFKTLAFDFFAMLSSPWVIGGMCMIVLSLIMDEGRKIQEEQELTV